MPKHKKYGHSQGICERCGKVADLHADPKAPRFGKGRHPSYIHPEDVKYCADCAGNIEAGMKRIKKQQERDAKEARRRYEKVRLEKNLPRNDDSRTRRGRKKMEFDK